MSDDPDAAAPLRERPWWRRAALRVALIGGAALALSPLLSKLPREQTLVFRSEDDGVRRLDVSWMRDGEPEALGGVSLSFPERSRRVVRHQVSLPNGEYLLSIAVERATGGETGESAVIDPRTSNARETSWVRRVNLEGGEIVIPVTESSTDLPRPP